MSESNDAEEIQNARIFKYKIIIGGEKGMYIIPTKDDFEAENKDTLKDLILFTDPERKEKVNKKLGTAFEQYEQQILGGIKIIRKTAKNNR
tara:strand:- start:1492 stop:1764 length:273 start_codon:yes stop_codon:yes gene_type:complete